MKNRVRRGRDTHVIEVFASETYVGVCVRDDTHDSRNIFATTDSR